jgi:hypothetical protein
VFTKCQIPAQEPTHRGLKAYQPEGLSENFNKHQLVRKVAGGEGKKNYPTKR